MDYLLYEPEDFASDESYLRYFFRLNDVDIAFWQNWISNHPERLDVITNADQLIGFLALHLDEAEYLHEYERLMQVISSQSTVSRQVPEINKNRVDTNLEIASPKNRNRRFAIAACVIGLLAIASLFLYDRFSNTNDPAISSIPFLSNKTIQKANTGNSPERVKLEDGTAVTLQPSSILTYPEHFEAGKREVYLVGEAFFEVTKNVSRPFFVYNKKLVTHVLGTSFTVKEDKQNGRVEVSVRTGKVEVYEIPEPTTKKADIKKSNGVILTPNQKMVYSEESKQFESSLVDLPMPILTDKTTKDEDVSIDLEKIILKATPVSEILKSIEVNYGIEVEVENENVSNCHFAGDVSEMNLYMKLDIICQSIGASYEIKGTKLLVRGKGCD